MQTKNQTTGNIRQKNRSIILAAAKKEFVLQGFKGASIKRIAEVAKIPRANVHYYFSDKTELYQEVLAEIIDVWNNNYDTLNVNDDPKKSLSGYIRSKVMFSKNDPEGSRIFASEIIHGAPILKDYLADEFHEWIKDKVNVINTWVEQELIDPINPYHLLFLIWGATQHYADFNVQVVSALGKKKLTRSDFEEVVNSLQTIILKGCGIK